MLGGEHQYQGGAVAQHQQVGSGQEDAEVRAPTVHIREHRGQAGRQADPAPPAEHAGVGAQGITEEARGAGGVKPLAVGRLRFTLALGEVVLLAAAAVRGGEQGPAVGSDLQGGLKGSQGGVLRPERTGVLWQTGWRRVHGMAEWMWLEPITEPMIDPLNYLISNFSPNAEPIH